MNILWFVPILSVMMFVHEFGHFITARMSGITVLEFGFGLPPRLWGFKRNGVIYSINWIPFGAFVKMLGEEDPSAPGSFASKPRGIRAIVLSAGSAMNFLLAVVAFSMVYIVGVPGVAPDSAVTVAEVAPDSPAQQAGLQPGDVIVGFDGQPVNVQSFRDATTAHLDQPIQIDVQRGEQTQTATLTPRSNPPDGQGAIGIVISGGLIRLSPLVALQQGLNQTVHVIGVTLSVPKMLLEGTIAPSDARLVGLVGMAQATSETVSYVADTGFWYPLFVLTGLFSAGLSIANMLPIPALDGGRLFFVILEWIRGRRIPPEREAAYHFVGIVVLLTIMVIISFNDLLSPMPAINWGGPTPTP
ncbi:MAG: site-2 protease family protein [Chloroflexi bacterium]|nr:site-2 protease family protein [Chloroflexota bacterium]MBV9596459.1 site-2 protease family protein [Chloroflexota bacterium]